MLPAFRACIRSLGEPALCPPKKKQVLVQECRLTVVGEGGLVVSSRFVLSRVRYEGTWPKRARNHDRKPIKHLWMKLNGFVVRPALPAGIIVWTHWCSGGSMGENPRSQITNPCGKAQIQRCKVCYCGVLSLMVLELEDIKVSSFFFSPCHLGYVCTGTCFDFELNPLFDLCQE